MFYDTDLYYSFLKNKNYELPDPPVNYAFRSTSSDPQLAINLHHALIIRAFHTKHNVANSFGLLKDRDWRLMQKGLSGNISDSLLMMIERQSRKMICKIIDDPQHWKEWLRLFDDENFFEETLFSEEKRESHQPSMNISFDNPTDILAPHNKLEEIIAGGQQKNIEINTKNYNFPFEITWRDSFQKEEKKPEPLQAKKFVMEATPSEQKELESTSKFHMTKKSTVSQLRIDETLITDHDSQIFSPRVNFANMSGRMTFTPQTLHNRAWSEAAIGNSRLTQIQKYRLTALVIIKGPKFFSTSNFVRPMLLTRIH